MMLKREVISSYSKTLCSRPIAWAIKEYFSNGNVRYALSSRKTYNLNCLFFDSFTDLEHYTTSKGWI